MSDIPEDLLADLDPDFHPLFGEKVPPTRHVVKEHDRHLPPKPDPIDPDQLTIPGMPDRLPPKPRVVTVKPHVRRNPRRKETHEMNETTEVDAATCLPPETRTDVTAMKDAQAVSALPGGVAAARRSDPATSHEAAKAATGSLRRRMVEVLRAFQDHEVFCRDMERAGSPQREGFTDEELVDHVTETQRFQPGKKASPSGVRTARKDLERAGLLQPLYEGVGCTPEMVLRPTRLGNSAMVSVLTEAGRDFVLPES